MPLKSFILIKIFNCIHTCNFKRSLTYNDYYLFYKAVSVFYLLRLHGTYEALVSGCSIDALVDLTGGIGQTVEFFPKEAEGEKKKNQNDMIVQEYRDTLYQCLLNTYRSSGYITIHTDQQGQVGSHNNVMIM